MPGQTEFTLAPCPFHPLVLTLGRRQQACLHFSMVACRDLPMLRSYISSLPSMPQAWSPFPPYLDQSPPQHSGLEQLPDLQCCVVSAEGAILSPSPLDHVPCGPSPRSHHPKLMAATVHLSALLRSCQPQPITVPLPWDLSTKGRTSGILLDPQSGLVLPEDAGEP